MSEDLVQLNLSVSREVRDKVDKFADKDTGGWTSKRQVVTTAVEALDELMKRHAQTAKKASDKGVRELFLRLARLMPVRLTDAKVEEARFSDGRPALIFMEEWVIGEDRNGDLMVVRKDGGQVGHVSHGEIKVLANVQTVEEIAPLKMPSAAEISLN